MIAKNGFDIEVCEDGSLKIDSDDFDTSKHIYADQFLEMIESNMGGKVVKNKKPVFKEMSVLRNKQTGKTKVRIRV